MRIILFLFIVINTSYAQRSIGLEVRSSRNLTYNNSEIIGGTNFTLTDERNTITTSYSLGLLLDFEKRGLFKIHVGRHRNGRVIDGRFYCGGHHGGSDDWEGINRPNSYLQIVPSFTYNFVFGKARIPLEFGIPINKFTSFADVFYIGIDDYNFDARISVGLEYEIFSKARIGLNSVYSKALTDYSEDYSIIGKHDPSQIGLELSLKFYFIEFAKKEMSSEDSESPNQIMMP